MEVFCLAQSSNDPMAPKWTRMVVISLLLHLAVFSIILFVPAETTPSRIRTGVYEVHLVEMPVSSSPGETDERGLKSVREAEASKKTSQAKRISRPEKKEQPAVIAKRTVNLKRQKAEKPEKTPSELIERAVSKIQQRVKEEKKDPVDQAIAKLEKMMGSSAGASSGSSHNGAGISSRIYTMQVEEKIKRNWSYPVDLIDPKDQKNFQAIIILDVKKDGTVTKAWFKSRSMDTRFNQSVIKAIERTGTLPPFPEGYRKTHDEIEINFNLSELENY